MSNIAPLLHTFLRRKVKNVATSLKKQAAVLSLANGYTRALGFLLLPDSRPYDGCPSPGADGDGFLGEHAGADPVTAGTPMAMSRDCQASRLRPAAGAVGRALAGKPPFPGADACAAIALAPPGTPAGGHANAAQPAMHGASHMAAGTMRRIQWLVLWPGKHAAPRPVRSHGANGAPAIVPGLSMAVHAPSPGHAGGPSSGGRGIGRSLCRVGHVPVQPCFPYTPRAQPGAAQADFPFMRPYHTGPGYALRVPGRLRQCCCLLVCACPV